MRYRVIRQFKLSDPPAGVSTRIHLEDELLDLTPESAEKLLQQSVIEVYDEAGDEPVKPSPRPTGPPITVTPHTDPVKGKR